MFKRLWAWLRGERTEPIPDNAIPDNARHVVQGSHLVLVTPAESRVVVEPVQHTDGGIMSRQDWLNSYGESSEDRYARNRMWLISQLPDECAFM